MSLENFHYDLRDALSTSFSRSEAGDVIETYSKIAKKKFGATDDNLHEFFEQHFGSCVDVDDALVLAFPDHFE